MIQLSKPVIIAIDGHSSCGKSSFAKSIAKELGYLYVDSGAMYRAVTLFAMKNGLLSNKNINLSALEKNINGIQIDFRVNEITRQYETYLNGTCVEQEIRSMDVSENVSEISKLKFVRKRLVDLQQKLGEKKGIVMDGRDIGTVVYPDAEIKLFMTASLQVRAERRHKELIEKGTNETLENVENNLSQRDFADQNRTESPLKQADDAIILDNSNITPSEQMDWFKSLLKEKFN
jgi:CMP/dCMP kinase